MHQGSDHPVADDQRIYMLTRVAQMYYDQNATQEAIAASLSLSRPTVSRLLKEAREEGVVQIRIESPFRFVPELETAVTRAFPHLKAVRIVRTADQAGLARAAAAYLANTVRDGDTIGVSWGNTMAAVADHLPRLSLPGATVVQLNGGVARAGAATAAHDIVSRFGQAFGAGVYYLQVPAVVDHPHMREVLLQNREIAEALDLGRKANLAVFTIGAPENDSVLAQAGYISPEHLARLRAGGAVGDICARFFTAEGQVCDPGLDERTIGLSLGELAQLGRSVAVVYGIHKAAGVLGALKGRLFNVLVLDEATAQEVLRQNQEGQTHHG
jgi:deoxyribonucleoside regulator